MATRFSIQEWDEYMNTDRELLSFRQLLEWMEGSNTLAPTDQAMADLRAAAAGEDPLPAAAANPFIRHAQQQPAPMVGVPPPPQPQGRGYQFGGSPFGGSPFGGSPFMSIQAGPLAVAPGAMGVASAPHYSRTLSMDEDSSKGSNNEIKDLIRQMQADTKKQLAELSIRVSEMETPKKETPKKETPKKKKKAPAKKGGTVKRIVPTRQAKKSDGKKKNPK